MMRIPLSRSTRWLFMLGVVAVVIVAALVHAGYEHRDIDVNSGRIRVRRYRLLGLFAQVRTLDTPFSMLAERFSLMTNPPDWRPASGRSVGLNWARGVRRDCYRMGRAIAACKCLVQAFEIRQASPAEQRQSVAMFLRWLAEEDTDSMERHVEGLVAHE